MKIQGNLLTIEGKAEMVRVLNHCFDHTKRGRLLHRETHEPIRCIACKAYLTPHNFGLALPGRKIYVCTEFFCHIMASEEYPDEWDKLDIDHPALDFSEVFLPSHSLLTTERQGGSMSSDQGTQIGGSEIPPGSGSGRWTLPNLS